MLRRHGLYCEISSIVNKITSCHHLNAGSNHHRMMHSRRASRSGCLELKGLTHGSVGLNDAAAHTTK